VNPHFGGQERLAIITTLEAELWQTFCDEMENTPTMAGSFC
jgi:hypothetical protein